MNRKRAIVAVTAVIVGASSVAAIAATSKDEPVRPAVVETPVTAAEPEATARFGFLSKARTAADTIPQEKAALIRENIPYGANLRLSKRIATHGDTAVYAVPGRGFICTVVPNADGATSGCKPTEAIARGNGIGPALIHSAKTDAVYAVVPDGVSTIHLELKSGATQSVDVQDGGYYVEVPTSDPPRVVSYDDPTGARIVQQVPIPPDVSFGAER